MGKSSKKSTPKVDTTPVSAIKSAKKGKRGAEEAIEKVVSAKKVKLENDEAVKAKQKLEKKQPKKVESSSNSEDSLSSESDIEPKQAVLKKTKKGKKDSTSESSDSFESESDVSDEEPKVTNKPAAVKNGTKKDASSSDESDSDSDSSDEETTGNAGKPSAKSSKDDSYSEEGSEESSDDEPSKVPQANNAQAFEKSNSSEDSSDEDSEESEEEGDGHPVRTPKKKDTDVEMVDASQNQTKNSEQSTAKKTPKTPEGGATGSKTLFVGNLSFTVEENDVREFFKNAGEVVDVRLACNPEGQFKGYGHVEFATPEDAQKALELNGQKLLDRDVRLDIAHERAAYTPHSRAQSLTVFVKGFDTSLGEDEIRSALQEHFGPCGEITRLSIPPDHESGGVKGMAYIDFTESDGFNKAVELDGSQVGGFSLFVQEAKPRGDNRDSGGRGGRSGGRGGRSGGRFGGRGSNSGGRFGGRGGRGGRFGRGGRGGGGGRGRGTPNKAPAGKKTTFGDD